MAVTATVPKMIDVREAASKAADYFKQLYTGASLQSVSLEEVELSDDAKHWLITLSYSFDDSALPTFFHEPKTKYKVFKVNAKTGRVVAMKIRKLE